MKVLVVAFCTAMFVFTLASVWTDILQPRVASQNLGKQSPKTASSTQRPVKQTARRPSEFVEPEDDQKEAASVAKVASKRVASRIKPPVDEVPLDDDAELLARQLEEVRRREAEVLARREALQMVYNDIHEELALSQQVHERANATLMAARERVTVVAQLGPDSPGNRRNNEERFASSRASRTITDTVSTESQGIRGMALIVRQMVSQGNESAARSFLRRMKEREAAKVLAALAKDEPKLATRLVGSLQVAGKLPDQN